MKITVIVPSFSRPLDLQRCLAAIGRQTRSADEVLVVGRESDNPTSEVVSMLRSSLPTLRLVGVAEPGLIAALNCGLDHAAGDLLALTDDDAEPNLDWLERIESGFDDLSVGAVGGRDWLQLPDQPALFEPAPVSKIGILTWYGTCIGDHHCPLRGNTKKVMFLKGVNMAFRRRALGRKRIDTTLHGSTTQLGTELDLCLHVWRAGYDVLFDDRILVKHYSSARVAGEDRSQLNGTIFSDLCFNIQYLIGKHLGFLRALAYFGNQRLLGSRCMPGLLACIKWHLKGDRLVWQRSRTIAWTGLAGFRAGRRARAVARQKTVDLNQTYSSRQLKA